MKWPAFDLETLAKTVDDLHEQTGLGVRNDFPLVRHCQPVLDDTSVYEDGLINPTAIA